MTCEHGPGHMVAKCDLCSRSTVARVEELDAQLSLVLADAHQRGHYGPVHATAELVLLKRPTESNTNPSDGSNG